MFSISFLVSFLLDGRYGSKLSLALESFCWTSVSDDSRVTSYKFGTAHNQNEDDAKLLVFEYLWRAEKGGSDHRLDMQVPFRPKAWPRSGLRNHLWEWKIVIGYR